MNAALGRTGVLLGFVAAAVGVTTLAVGLRRDRPSLRADAGLYAWLLLGGAVLATFSMEHALLTHDFALTYVWENNSRGTPLLFTITGMWSALEGSILLWALVLCAYIAAMVHRFRNQSADRIVGWSTLTAYVVAAFFFGLMLGPANPFKTFSGRVPADGLGPNPLLQDHPLVAFHPPLLYLGLVGFTIPFALAVASLVTGRLEAEWQLETHRWTLAAWGFLTVGVVLGAWWSYQVLGWGGFWAWDPVENAAFIPWLCATAYLHSVVAQQRRGLMRVWSLSLLMATFSLTILATFLTRSGVLDSVHSFSTSSLGPVLLGFFGAIVATAVGLIAWRSDRLRSAGSIRRAVSRESAFLANNVLFAGFAFVVLLGTVFPLIVVAVEGQQITIGRPYFDEMTRPIGLTLLFLMAVAPVLPWRRASAEVLRTNLALPAWVGVLTVAGSVIAGVRGTALLTGFGLAAAAGTTALRQLALSVSRARRSLSLRSPASAWRALFGPSNGGMIVHLGVVVIAVALSASLSYGHRAQIVLRPGQTASFAGHRLTYLGSRQVASPNKEAVVALVRVDGGNVLDPAVSHFRSTTEGIGTPAVDTGLAADVYLSLASSPQGSNGPVAIGVVVQPMVLWLWIGGALMALGTVVAVAGRRSTQSEPSEPRSSTRASLLVRRRDNTPVMASGAPQ